MTTKILAAVPNDPLQLSSSFVQDLLGKLAIFFFSLPAGALYADVSRTVGQYRRVVEDAWPVLAIVSSIANQSKRRKQVSLSNADMGMIHNLGMNIPHNPEEAMDVTTKIMNLLTHILSVRNWIFFHMYYVQRFAVLPGITIRAKIWRLLQRCLF